MLAVIQRVEATILALQPAVDSLSLLAKTRNEHNVPVHALQRNIMVLKCLMKLHSKRMDPVGNMENIDSALRHLNSTTDSVVQQLPTGDEETQSGVITAAKWTNTVSTFQQSLCDLHRAVHCLVLLLVSTPMPDTISEGGGHGLAFSQHSVRFIETEMILQQFWTPQDHDIALHAMPSRAKHCPSVFWLFPTQFEGENWLEGPLTIVEVCPVTLCVVPCGPGGLGWRVEASKELLSEWAPALLFSVGVLLSAVAAGRAVGVPLPSAGGDLLANNTDKGLKDLIRRSYDGSTSRMQTESSLNLFRDALVKMMGEAGLPLTALSSAWAQPYGLSISAIEASLRSIHAYIGAAHSGLEQVTAPNGDSEWVMPGAGELWLQRHTAAITELARTVRLDVLMSLCLDTLCVLQYTARVWVVQWDVAGWMRRAVEADDAAPLGRLLQRQADDHPGIWDKVGWSHFGCLCAVFVCFYCRLMSCVLCRRGFGWPAWTCCFWPCGKPERSRCWCCSAPAWMLMSSTPQRYVLTELEFRQGV